MPPGDQFSLIDERPTIATPRAVERDALVAQIDAESGAREDRVAELSPRSARRG